MGAFPDNVCHELLESSLTLQKWVTLTAGFVQCLCLICILGFVYAQRAYLQEKSSPAEKNGADSFGSATTVAEVRSMRQSLIDSTPNSVSSPSHVLASMDSEASSSSLDEEACWPLTTISGWFSLKTASQGIMLPVYWKILTLYLVFQLYQSILLVFDTHVSPVANAILSMISWAVYHFVLEGTCLVLCQYGCGYKEVREASHYAMGWGFFTLVYKGSEFLMFATGVIDMRSSIAMAVGYEFMLVSFYFVVAFAPKKWFYRRPAAYRYAYGWSFIRLISFLAGLTFVFNVISVGNCLHVVENVVLFPFVGPIVVYTSLQLDSLYWQGLQKRSRSNDVESQNSSALSIDSAHQLVQGMDLLQSQSSVRFINYHELALAGSARSALVGSGGTARVFRGYFRGCSVAVKHIMFNVLTPDTIDNFVREVGYLAQIRSKYVVHVYGVSIVPPTLCMVLELCHYGSLFDYLRNRRIGNIPFSRKVKMMLDCARGILALHSLDPPVLHLDVKSLNFLVNKHHRVKIADLEFGQRVRQSTHIVASTDRMQHLHTHHRSVYDSALSATSRTALASGSTWGSNSSIDRNPGVDGVLDDHSSSSSSESGYAGNVGHVSMSNLSEAEAISPILGAAAASSEDVGSSASCELPNTVTDEDGNCVIRFPSYLNSSLRSSRFRSRSSCGDMTEFVVPDTINWMPPELLMGREFDLRADIYSLAMVFYEILSNGGVPFVDKGYMKMKPKQQQLHVYERAVMRGERPKLRDGLPQDLVNLVTRCWDADPSNRPHAAQLVEELTVICDRYNPREDDDAVLHNL